MGTWPQEVHQAFVDRKRAVRMDQIDNLPEPIRALIHQYSFSVVNAFMQVGVKKPKQIRHLIETVLDEFSPTRGSFSQQGVRTQIHDLTRGHQSEILDTIK